eukprot:jgi/Bigna1/136775/aug1.35_g11483
MELGWRWPGRVIRLLVILTQLTDLTTITATSTPTIGPTSSPSASPTDGFYANPSAPPDCQRSWYWQLSLEKSSDAVGAVTEIQLLDTVSNIRIIPQNLSSNCEQFGGKNLVNNTFDNDTSTFWNTCPGIYSALSRTYSLSLHSISGCIDTIKVLQMHSLNNRISGLQVTWSANSSGPFQFWWRVSPVLDIAVGKLFEGFN